MEKRSLTPPLETFGIKKFKENEGEGNIDYSEYQLDGSIELRFILKGKQPGSIIGPKGVHIDQIRSTSNNCRIQIVPKVGNERVVGIYGNMDAVHLAIPQIVSRLMIDLPPDSTDLIVEFLVPNDIAENIIGPKKSQILSYQTIYNVSILVEAQPMPNTTERLFRINGDADGIIKTLLDMSFRLLQNSSQHDPKKMIHYIPNNDTVTSSSTHIPKPAMVSTQSNPYNIFSPYLPQSSTTIPSFPTIHSQPPTNATQLPEIQSIPETDGSVTIEIPKEFVGCVIGPSGSTIKNIRLNTGCNMSIAKETECAQKTVRPLTISGPSPQNVQLAKHYVMSIIEQKQGSNISTVPPNPTGSVPVTNPISFDPSLYYSTSDPSSPTNNPLNNPLPNATFYPTLPPSQPLNIQPIYQASAQYYQIPK